MTEAEGCHDMCCHCELDASRGHQNHLLEYVMFISIIQIQIFFNRLKTLAGRRLWLDR